MRHSKNGVAHEWRKWRKMTPKNTLAPLRHIPPSTREVRGASATAPPLAYASEAQTDLPRGVWDGMSREKWSRKNGNTKIQKIGFGRDRRTG
jgi:hypothetical protein